MVDVFRLFKLGTSVAKMLKASKHVYDAKMIFDVAKKPIALLGIGGLVDAAAEDCFEVLQQKLDEAIRSEETE